MQIIHHDRDQIKKIVEDEGTMAVTITDREDIVQYMTIEVMGMIMVITTGWEDIVLEVVV